MNKLFLTFLALSSAILVSFSTLDATDWRLSDDYRVRFEAKNATGNFKDLKGVIHFDPTDLSSSKFNMEIDVNSIQTGFFLKNKHAKGENWFDAETYPTINFVSSNISKTDSGFKVRGLLNIHGIEKEISFPFTFEDNTFASQFDVNRLDFKVGSNEGLAAKVPAEITVILNVPVEN